MRRFDLNPLHPALALAACALVASFLVVHAGGSRWPVYGATLLLAIAVPAADIWRSCLRGLPAWPSSAALIMAGAVIVAGVIVGMDDPSEVRELMPVLCAVMAVANLRDRRCLHRRPANPLGYFAGKSSVSPRQPPSHKGVARVSQMT